MGVSRGIPCCYESSATFLSLSVWLFDWVAVDVEGVEGLSVWLFDWVAVDVEGIEILEDEAGVRLEVDVSPAVPAAAHASSLLLRSSFPSPSSENINEAIKSVADYNVPGYKDLVLGSLKVFPDH